MAQELLLELNRRGIKLRLVDDRIDVLAPAGSLTPELREQLKVQRDTLLTLLRGADAAADLTGISPRPDQAHQPFPLTDIQHAYWVGSNPAVELGGVSTHFYFELERDGLDPGRLTDSFRRVVARHPMLRAVVAPDGQQLVLPEVPEYEIEVADLRDLAPAEREVELARVRADLGHRAPAAERWPLFEIRASRLDGGRIRLHLSMNLLIMDAFSLSLMFADWRRFYEEPDWTPEPLPFTFRDYVQAAESLRQGASYRAAEEYWLSRLDSLPPAPALPLARQPAQLARTEFTGRAGRLAKDRWDFIRKVARGRRLTPSAVLMTAFADVLRTWSAQPAFTLNVTLFNRPPVHPRIDEIIGDFTSLTMLEVRTGPDEAFAVRARRLQEQLMRDLEHVSFSGVRVLRERARRAGGGPDAAMPVVFTGAVPLTTDVTPDGSRPFFGELVYNVSQTPQVFIDHQVMEESGALLFNWDCVEALFPGGLLDDAFAAYRSLLDRLSRSEYAWDATEPVRLPSWQTQERARANDTAAAMPGETLCGIVAAQVRRRPDSVAVIAGDGTLTYQQVSDDAHRLARRLAALGAGPGTLVGVVLDKGCAQVPAVLAVTVAGAAYLPVDPQWPEARRHQVLARGGVRLVVTSPEHRDELAWPSGTEVVTLDDEDVRVADPAPLAAGPAPDDLAYVIFTSGSTGQPKGVMIDHRGAVNTIVDINRRFRVGPDDRVLALSSLTFDLSVYDIFGTLAAGGAIVMPDPAGERDGAHWSELAGRHGVTVWNSVPALMQAWLDARTTGAGDDRLRLVMLSGDWIPVSLPDAVRAAHPGAEVVSLGGATEASIWSVWFPIGEVPPDWTRIPYGKPLSNQTLHVYDERLAPCPVWTAGELYIGGTGVAKGYWADPEQTGYRFITHPDTGERLYRTGDLARYLPGGDIEFLGRNDFQVKLNGYRIELNEIAEALRRCPGVGEALVDVAVHPETGRRQLVGYVVPSRETTVDLVVSDLVAADPTGAVADRDGPAGAAFDGLVEAGEKEVREASAALAADLATFEGWWRELEQLCPAIIARTMAQLGRFTAAGQTATAGAIVDSCGILPQHLGLVEQWLSTLEAEGLLTATGPAGEYRCERPFDVGGLDRAVEAGLAAVDVTGVHRTFVDYLRVCVANQIGLLRGEVSPLQLLVPDEAGLVTDALYAANPSSRVQNLVAARVVRAFVDGAPGGRPVRVVEVGAGTGATSAAILPGLPADRVRYRFTDISTFFTARARGALAGHPFVEYGVYDIDREPAGQDLPPGSADLIVGANVLHDAKDLEWTLAQLCTVLSAGGVLVLIEGTENSRLQLISVGFIEGFAHHQGRYELPLRSVAQWRDSLRRAGFTRFASLPEGAAVCTAMAQHVLVAAAPGGGTPVDQARLRQALSGVLPDYMVPQHYLRIERIPLSANGKVDRSALPSPWAGTAGQELVAPRDSLERRLFDIWREVLGRDDFGVEDNFFELGGDSLHAVRILARLRDEFGVELTANEGLQTLFDQPSVAGLASALRERAAPS